MNLRSPHPSALRCAVGSILLRVMSRRSARELRGNHPPYREALVGSRLCVTALLTAELGGRWQVPKPMRSQLTLGEAACLPVRSPGPPTSATASSVHGRTDIFVMKLGQAPRHEWYVVS